MQGGYRILDFRNRPPLPAYAALFEIKRSLLGNQLKRMALECRFRWLTKSVLPLRNPGAATCTASMQCENPALAMKLWWQEIDAAGIDAVVCNGRISGDRGNIDAASLARLEAQYPGRFLGLAPVDLEIAVAETVAQCEHAVRALGLRGINIEPGIRKRGGPAQADHPDLYPIYESMSALDVPVMVYTSPFAGPTVDTANDMRPYARVLEKFPTLRLILGHGGYPRVRQVIETARRHSRLYICQDIYSFWPGGTRYLRNIEALQDQFLFGTSYPFSSLAQPVDATLRLPLSATAMQKYLWTNGARLLKLPQVA
jgi:hypothetical protein